MNTAKRERLVKIEGALKTLNEERTQLYKELQAECTHPAIIERDFIPANIVSDAMAPRRRCLFCHLEEDGWGCGYKALKGRILTTVSRDVFVSTSCTLQPLVSVATFIPQSMVEGKDAPTVITAA